MLRHYHIVGFFVEDLVKTITVVLLTYGGDPDYNFFFGMKISNEKRKVQSIDDLNFMNI